MKILFLDDDTDAVSHFIQNLEDAGNTVTHIWTIREAEQKTSGPVFSYDLVIIDVQIRPSEDEKRTPEASLNAGLTFYYAFRDRFPKARAIILTNNLYRVPVDLLRQSAVTKALDKVAMAGLLAEEIRRWVH